MSDRPSYTQNSTGATLRDLRKRRHSIDFVFVLMVLAAFIIVGPLLIELGTGIYSRIINTMNDNANERTTVAYIRQKVRSVKGSASGTSVVIDSLESGDGTEPITALLLKEDIAGQPYELYLYAYDGSMRELLVKEGNDQIPASAGTEILSCNSMTLEQEDRAILVTVENEDGKQSFLIDQ